MADVALAELHPVGQRMYYPSVHSAHVAVPNTGLSAPFRPPGAARCPSIAAEKGTGGGERRKQPVFGPKTEKTAKSPVSTRFARPARPA